MRGRGRGRGGRGPTISITQDLVRDNLEDLGIDQQQRQNLYNSSDRTPPPLFPAIAIQPPSKLSESDRYSIQKMREISLRFQSSPYYLTRKTEHTDISRYTDKYRNLGPQVTLMECINSSLEDSTRYIPYELLEGSAIGTRISSRYGNSSSSSDGINSSRLDKKKEEQSMKMLEEQEKAGEGAAAAGGGLDGGIKKDGVDIASDEEGDEQENELDELDDDYGIDHYASGDEGGGGSDGGDNEATF